MIRECHKIKIKIDATGRQAQAMHWFYQSTATVSFFRLGKRKKYGKKLKELTAWSVVFLLYGTGIKRSCNSPPITLTGVRKEIQMKIKERERKKANKGKI